jgi:hypothetical protein
MTIDELKREALQLDPSTRAGLARDLLVSLDDLSEAEVERPWVSGLAIGRCVLYTQLYIK